MKIKITVALASIALILFSGSGFCQPSDSTNPKMVTMAAGPQFAASGWKKFWWGKHWRDEWLMPASFPHVNIDTLAGGLTPTKRGGGHETKTLRLMGNDHREYVLRTIDKSLDILVPEEFHGTFVNDVVNDQISTAHPYGPLVVANLSAAAGVLHTNPVIVFVTASDNLGEYKKDFGDKLCLFEERPSGEGWDHTPLTNNGKEIINSEKLFEELASDHKKSVDQHAFLRVRLIDMLINDWDRHSDQWVWVAHKKSGKTIYTAFARDRDQSFSKTDGVNLYFLSRPWTIRSLQDIKPHVKDVIGLNLSATALDRSFMNELTEQDWRSTITSVQQSLPDSVIKNAIMRMPASIAEKSFNFLYKVLRSRRDDMMRFGMLYYKKLNKEVAIGGTNEDEVVTINKLSASATEITINTNSDTIFHHVFGKNITSEIDVYGIGGNDNFVFTGRRRNRIKLRAIGNEGTDRFTDSTTTKGNGKPSLIYDTTGTALSLSGSYKTHITADTAHINIGKPPFKYDLFAPLLFPAYNPDDGLFIGAALLYRKQRWGKTPFGWQQTVGGTYAAATGAYSFFYKGTFKQTFGKWDLTMDASYKAPTYIINYYGMGNNTSLQDKNKSFYRTHAESLFFNPAISRNWKKNTLNAGLLFESFKIKSDDAKYINRSAPVVDSTVFNTQNFIGANGSYTFSTSNLRSYPTKGIVYHLTATYLRNIKNDHKDFVNLASSFTCYFSPVKNITLAHRTGGAGNMGDFEFYQANALGGTENLRGYWRTRFAGRSAFYQNTDIRWKIADLKGYFFRGGIGIYGFFDDGRVWYKNDASGNLHTGVGGGFYFIPFNMLALNISYGHSKEANVFAIRAGFLF